MESDHIVDIAREYSDALKWIEGIIQKPVQGRLREAEKIVSEYSRSYKNGELEI
jgi:hypothetical protein